MTIWLVRAGKYGEQEQTALDKGIVIIGWNELPDLSAVNDRETLATLYKQVEGCVAVKRIWALVREE